MQKHEKQSYYPLILLKKPTSMLPIFLVLIVLSYGITTIGKEFSIKEATVEDIQIAFKQNRLTSKQLVEFYIKEIQRLNPILKSVIEVNPDAVYQAEEADREREAKRANRTTKLLFGLHGIPILLKDNIATKDKLNTTAGSYALLGSVVPRDAGVVKKLRKAGAIILGKASLSEWANIRSNSAPDGWSARGGQPLNPYVVTYDPCGSSTGSAISVAANMAAVSLGTETDGSILCPCHANSVVGIKPTLGLTSRAGVVPITHRQDTVGTVSDAAYVLDAIVGFDKYDSTATRKASKYIPKGGYSRFLKSNGLKGKRLGIFSAYAMLGFNNNSELVKDFEPSFHILRQSGSTLLEPLEIIDLSDVQNMFSGEEIALKAELKIDLNAYLKQLVASPVRSLADVIAFNNKHAKLERLKEYGQEFFLEAEKTNGIGKLEKDALRNLTRLSKDGFEKMMKENKLDAVVAPFADLSSVLAIGGYPGISVPAGYDEKGIPYGICFGGLKGSEPTLIEIAYGFEQATKIRKSPPV